MPERHRYSAGELSDLLSDRIEQLCADLLPGGRREGPEWRAGSPQGEAGKSLGVHLTGGRAGVWSDFASGESGDALDLVRAAQGCDTAEACRWALAWLGLSDEDAPRKTAPPKPRQKTDQDTSGKTREWARQLWASAEPIQGTLAERYLRSRGITVDPLPPTLRFHPRAKHGPSGQHFPAMISAVQRLAPDGKSFHLVAVHRTFLSSDGGKAPVPETKMTLGPIKAGAVRLAPAGERLALAEGIETALSVMSADPDLPTWAALSTGGMRALVLPQEVQKVLLCLDGDPEGERAGLEAGHRFQEEGRRVRLARPPEGRDFNDVLLGRAG
ncbi:DUF7146 domain-containing protein [Fodinicurvata sediminis]|uniref:DUF7146 domain-containing protein n=1 Tax=Fodinicurvata sediminis TaxID=1121832 RepID=UPI0003B5ADF2|nr:toprim domain-containing protein [Fodinicurvata sediminis]